MGKQPYIPIYIGDYLKDTRVLPLNVRGGWMDLILYMWENPVKGELVGTHEDFARMMSCSIEEAVLVIQTLNQKNMFGYAKLPDGRIKIESRKIKKMVEISNVRKVVGMRGGNPKLKVDLVNQKDNLNAENENSIIVSNNIEKESFRILSDLRERWITISGKELSEILEKYWVSYKQNELEALHESSGLLSQQVVLKIKPFVLTQYAAGIAERTPADLWSHFTKWVVKTSQEEIKSKGKSPNAHIKSVDEILKEQGG